MRGLLKIDLSTSPSRVVHSEPPCFFGVKGFVPIFAVNLQCVLPDIHPWGTPGCS
jgi:hypothetical protein